MKKKILLVSTLLVIALSAMLVSCKSKNEPTNGCKCSTTLYGETTTEAMSMTDMINELGIQSCGALTDFLKDFYLDEGYASVQVSCVGY